MDDADRQFIRELRRLSGMREELLAQRRAHRWEKVQKWFARTYALILGTFGTLVLVQAH